MSFHCVLMLQAQLFLGDGTVGKVLAAEAQSLGSLSEIP